MSLGSCHGIAETVVLCANPNQNHTKYSTFRGRCQNPCDIHTFLIQKNQFRKIYFLKSPVLTFTKNYFLFQNWRIFVFAGIFGVDTQSTPKNKFPPIFQKTMINDLTNIFGPLGPWGDKNVEKINVFRRRSTNGPRFAVASQSHALVFLGLA